jgi:hypothetical protein
LRPQPGEQSKAAARKSAKPQRISASNTATKAALNEQKDQKGKIIVTQVPCGYYMILLFLPIDAHSTS